MTQTELIKAEVERLEKEANDRHEDDCYLHALYDVQDFIESLEKEELMIIPRSKSKSFLGDAALMKSLEKEQDVPTIKGWVARDIHGTLRLYGNDAADGMGIRTGELPSPYKELTAEDEPIEVELTIHRV